MKPCTHIHIHAYHAPPDAFVKHCHNFNHHASPLKSRFLQLPLPSLGQFPKWNPDHRATTNCKLRYGSNINAFIGHDAKKNALWSRLSRDSFTHVPRAFTNSTNAIFELYIAFPPALSRKIWRVSPRQALRFLLTTKTSLFPQTSANLSSPPPPPFLHNPNKTESGCVDFPFRTDY